jgi:2,3-bisphosphoglycerate-dependent phosphoglycerate mutase
MSEILLIRHGEACIGPSRMDRDYHLTQRGQQQAHRLGRELAAMKLKPARIYCSTLTRARETAGILARHVPAPLHQQPELIEHGSRVLTLDCSLDDAVRRHPKLLRLDGSVTWSQGSCDGLNGSFCIGGETVRQLHRRAKKAWKKIVGEVSPGQTVLVVAHGSFLSAMLTEALSLPLAKVWRFNFVHTGFVRVKLIDDAGGVRVPVLCAHAVNGADASHRGRRKSARRKLGAK